MKDNIKKKKEIEIKRYIIKLIKGEFYKNKGLFIEYEYLKERKKKM